MNNVLFEDRPTTRRVLNGKVKRVVYARYDHEGNFVRFVVHRTIAEMKSIAKQYLPAKVGVTDWYEVFEYNMEKA